MPSNINFFDLIDQASDLVQQVDANGRFLYVNQRWQKALGYTTTEAIHLHFHDILYDDFIIHSQDIWQQLQQGRQFEQIELTFVTKTGYPLYLAGHLTPLFEETTFTGALGMFRDVSRHKLIEESLAAHLRKSHALYHVTNSLIAITNLQEIMQTITNSVAEALPASRVLLHIFDMAQQRVKHFVTGGPEADNVIAYTFEQLMNSLNGWVIRESKPAIASKNLDVDTRISSDIQALRQTLASGAIIVVPLHYQGQTLGTLTAINRPDEADFGESDMELMMAMGNQVALALENARLYEENQQRLTILEQRNEELDVFARTVAHDLKSPLTALIAYGEASEELLQQKEYERLPHFLKIIHQMGTKMSSIIDELMLLSQVRQAKKIPLTAVVMDTIIYEALNRLAYMIDTHQATIHTPTIWPIAMGYAPWVEEIWVNYISNAIKYGGSPPIIELGADVDAENGRVHFWVQDNGAGINTEDQADLFIPFERLEQVDTKGHGLGLSIAKRITDKLGGAVGIESEEGRGSRFYFTLLAAS